MKNLSKTLVLLPTYNEIKNLEEIISSILHYLPSTHILVIDDSSPDGTGLLADRLSQEKPDQVFVLHRHSKEGLGRAYIAGFQWALEKDYEFIFEMDADFSHDPRYLPLLLQIAQNADLALGSRYIEGGGVKGWAWHRRLLSLCGNFYVRSVLGMKIRDLTGGFKCFRRKVLQSLDFKTIKSNGYLFQIEMSYFSFQKGFKIEEMPIIFEERRAGFSKMNHKIVWEALLNVWRLKK